MSPEFYKSKLFFALATITVALSISVGGWAATTIGNDINTDGNLIVNGKADIKQALTSFDLDVNGDARITNDLYFGGTGDSDTSGYLQQDGTDFVFSTSIKPAGYLSRYGEAGISTTVFVKDKADTTCTLDFYDGLLTASSCPEELFE